MAGPGTVGPKVGVGMGAEVSTTIANGDTTHAAPVDLGQNYLGLLVWCEDCSNISASSDLAYATAILPGETVCDVYDPDDVSTLYGDGDNLPTTGTWRVFLSPLPLAGARYVKLTLGAATGGAVVFKMRGIDPIIASGD